AARVSDRTGFFTIAGTGQPGKLIEMDSTEKMFSNPERRETQDYVTGRFG
ncbi:MAG: phosphate ABC transporter ATP-binding protein, partial [Actinomycetota bacterium]